MGKGDSKSSNSNIVETYSGANQVSGSDNLTLSGVKEMGDINFTQTKTDYDAISKAFDYAHDNSSNGFDLAESVVDNSFKYGLESQANYSGFMAGVFDKFSDATSDNANKAFNAIGANALQMSEANNSETTEITNNLIKAGTIIGGLFGSAILYKKVFA